MQDEVKYTLTAISRAFREGEAIPQRNTARGENISPNFTLNSLSPNAKSVAVLLDDMSHPIFKIYNHWVIWNLPPKSEIPEGIPHGKNVEGGAVQGIGYGRHRYKGPKPPRGTTHTYRFTFYVLDTILELPASSKKKRVLAAMEGHILQSAALSGIFHSV